MASRFCVFITILFLSFCLCILTVNCDHQYQSKYSMLYKDDATMSALHLAPKYPSVSQEEEEKRRCNKKCPTEEKNGYRRVFKEECEVAQLQGRRRYQEDRTICTFINIPWPQTYAGQAGMQSRKVGLLAVFDGHNGAEASELAASLLPEYFIQRVYFLLEGLLSGKPFDGLKMNFEGLSEAGQLSRMVGRNELLTEYRRFFEDVSSNEDRVPGGERYGLHCLDACSKEDEDQFSSDSKEDENQFSSQVSLNYGFMKNFELQRSQWNLLGFSEDSIYRMILKEALIRAISDIDIAFTNEAFRNNLHSGSTASIVLKADEYILVANIGDSKSLLCSACSNLPEQSRDANWRKHKRQRNNQDLRQEISNNSYSLLCVKELTQDHHPDRDEEKARIEAAGGFVMKWGDVPRVNGDLAISRAIGDVSFKKYGVISEPEVTDWQRLSSNDSHLIVASDGLFEKMNTQDICNLLIKAQQQNNHSTEIVPDNIHSSAWPMVNTAFERGSMDNLAAVVLPLESFACAAEACLQNRDCTKDYI